MASKSVAKTDTTDVATADDEFYVDLLELSKNGTQSVNAGDYKDISFEDIVNELDVESVGYDILDKSKIAGIPLVILEWSFHQSKKKDDAIFAVLVVKTKTGEFGMVTDGSNVMRELARITTSRARWNAENPTLPARPEFGLVKGTIRPGTYTDPETGEVHETWGLKSA